MLADMDVDYADLTNAQAVQLVGLAIGCIFVIPFSRKYGRRSTYIFSTALLAAACWWTVYMESRLELYFTSLLCGLAGAPNETVVQMSVSFDIPLLFFLLAEGKPVLIRGESQITDMFFLHQRATANAVYFIAVMMGSFLIPMVAGYQASVTGWRTSYLALAIALTVLTVLFIPFFEETKYIPVISGDIAPMSQLPEAKTDALVASDENGSEKGTHSGEPREDLELQAIRTVTNTAGTVLPRPKSLRQRLRLFTPSDEPLLTTFYYPIYTTCLPHVVFTAVQFASSICWLVVVSSMISIIFSAPPYNFDSAALGYMFTGPFIGSLLGSAYGGPLSDWAIVRLAKRNGGIYEPEMRLYLFPFQALITAGGLIMFGVTADKVRCYTQARVSMFRQLISCSRACIGSILV